MAEGSGQKKVDGKATYLEDGEALYVVWSRLGLAPEIDPGWYEEFAPEGMCPGCDCIAPAYAPTPVNIVLNTVPTGISLSDGFLKIFYWPFLQKMLPHMSNYVLGSVSINSGSGVVQCSEYRTCYPLPGTEIIYHGNGMPDERCAACSRWLYQWVDGIVIARESIPKQSVVQDIFWNLWLRPSLVREIDWTELPDAFLEEVRLTQE